MPAGGRVVTTLGRGGAGARCSLSAVVVAGAALGAAADAAGEAAVVALIVDGDAAMATVSNCHQKMPRYGGRCSSWEL